MPHLCLQRAIECVVREIELFNIRAVKYVARRFCKSLPAQIQYPAREGDIPLLNIRNFFRTSGKCTVANCAERNEDKRNNQYISHAPKTREYPFYYTR